MADHTMKRWSKRVAWLVALGLLGWLIMRTDLSRVFEQLRQVSWPWLVALVFMQSVTIVLVSIQWKLLSVHMRLSVPLRDVFVMNMGGTFIESITPAVKTGGEVYKVYHLHREVGLAKKVAVGLVAVQKMVSLLGFIVLLWVVLVTVIALGVMPDTSWLWLGFWVTISVLIIIGWVLLIAWRWHHRSENQTVTPFQTALLSMKTRLWMGWLHAALSLTIWSLYGLKTTLILFAILGEWSFVTAFTATLLAYTVGMLPISPGGLGTYEATFVSVFETFGVTAESGLAVVVLLRLVTFWFSLWISLMTVAVVYTKRKSNKVVNAK